jgi:tRNA/tmRNA/rRNA uracil-C5-methylase (TrmA/RlmC/RlmD family)
VHHPAINAALHQVQRAVAALGISAYDERSGGGELRYVQLTVVDPPQGVSTASYSSGRGTAPCSSPGGADDAHPHIQLVLVWNAEPDSRDGCEGPCEVSSSSSSSSSRSQILDESHSSRSQILDESHSSRSQILDESHSSRSQILDESHSSSSRRRRRSSSTMSTTSGNRGSLNRRGKSRACTAGERQRQLAAALWSEEHAEEQRQGEEPRHGERVLWHSIWINFNTGPGNAILGQRWKLLHGEEDGWSRLRGLAICHGPGAFMQANQEAMEACIQSMQPFVHQGNAVVDMHAGVGTIGE